MDLRSWLGTGDGGTFKMIHECGEADYVDRTGTAAGRTVTFGAPSAGYNPPCMSIGSGQSVTFAGNFGTHPLRPGTAPSRTDVDPDGSPGNPITATDAGTTAEFTFPDPGIYPCYCDNHHDSFDMYGVIRVTE